MSLSGEPPSSSAALLSVQTAHSPEKLPAAPRCWPDGPRLWEPLKGQCTPRGSTGSPQGCQGLEPGQQQPVDARPGGHDGRLAGPQVCLLYTSDAADEEDSVDLGGRRIIKKK